MTSGSQYLTLEDIPPDDTGLGMMVTFMEGTQHEQTGWLRDIGDRCVYVQFDNARPHLTPVRANRCVWTYRTWWQK